MGYTDYIVIALLAVSVVLNIITFVTNSKNKNLAEKFPARFINQLEVTGM